MTSLADPVRTYNRFFVTKLGDDPPPADMDGDLWFNGEDDTYYKSDGTDWVALGTLTPAP